MRRIASALIALGMLAATASSAAASDLSRLHQSVGQGSTQITTIAENGRPVNLARLNYRYRSSLGADNPYTTRVSTGARVEVWKLQAPLGQCLDVTMRSDDLDSFVGLYRVSPFSGDADKLVEDDDSAGGLTGRDAHLRQVVPATGAYYVVAASAKMVESGRYTLEIASCDGAGASTSSGWPTPRTNANPFTPRF